MECIREGVMEDFLIAHRAEVIDVCITEYNEEKVMDAIREEDRMEGREEGHEEGIGNTLQTALDFGADLQAAIAKTAERYKEDEKKIWDIWEKGNK